MRIGNPCSLTVLAKAPKIAKGANFMTISVTFSIMAEASSASSMTRGDFFSSIEMAVPTKTAKMTICRISLSAMALMIDDGIRCSMKASIVKPSVEGTLIASPATWRLMPTPGFSHSTISIPITSERTDMTRNQPRALIPTRPTEAASSIWPIPAIRVNSTSGAMIILIRVMKILVSKP